MHRRLENLLFVLSARRPPQRIFIFCAAWLLVAPAGAQTPSHQHPVIRKQPQPAGATSASGSGAPPSAPARIPAAGGHTGMAMPAGHQMNQMSMSFGPLSDAREASRTAWQPEATPMHAHHSMLGDRQFMTHYNAFLAYDDQSGPRGDKQFNSINSLSYSFKPEDLDARYGKKPVGFWIFLRLRPAAMAH